MSGNSGSLSRTVSSTAPAGVRGAARASPHSSAQSFCQSSAPWASVARSAAPVSSASARSHWAG